MAVGELLTIGAVAPDKLKKYTVSREKLWTDADRNLAGSLKATLIGTFPKLFLSFAATTQAEMSTIIGLLDPAKLTVQWWNEENDSIETGYFYAGSYDIPLFSKPRGLYEEFDVNLISYDKLT